METQETISTHIDDLNVCLDYNLNEFIVYDIQSAIRNNKFVEERYLDLISKGYKVEEKPMGSGGVGQIKQLVNGEIRIQIGYGHGRSNYAMAVILENKG